MIVLPLQNTFAGLSPPWSLVSLDANFTTLWNAFLKLLSTTTAVKPADTSRTSTTTLAVDPDLQVTLGAGTYRYEFSVDFQSTAAGATPGVSYLPAFSGTFTSGSGQIIFGAFTGDGNSGNFGVAVAPPVSGVPLSLRATPPNNNNVLIIGHIIVSVSGVLSLYWAQTNSSGTSTVAKAGSHLIASQLA